jgi:hypothetical protein
MLCGALLALFVTGCGFLTWVEDFFKSDSTPDPEPTPGAIIINPTPVPTQMPLPSPSPTPLQSDFCSGHEVVCIETMTRAAVEAQGGNAVEANFEYDAFYPEPKGGLVFPLSFNTDRSIIIEFDIQGLIFPEYTLPELRGGKVCLLAFKGDDAYAMSLQRMHGEYRNSDGIFRLMFRENTSEERIAFAITLSGFSGHYSTADWQPGEIHHFKIELHQDSIRLSIDDYVSKSVRVRSNVSGTQQVGFVLGNRAQDKMGAGQGARTMFLNLKITN